MIRQPPRSTRTDTLFPYTTLFRSGFVTRSQADAAKPADVELASETGQNSARYFTDWALPQLDMLIDEGNEPIDVYTTLDLGMQRAATAAIQADAPRGVQGALVSLDQIGRAHVCTPVTNAHLVCRLLLEKKQK